VPPATTTTSEPGINCDGVPLDGYCWYLGGDGLSCDQVCASHGGCNHEGIVYAGSEGSASVCTAVLYALGAPPGEGGVATVTVSSMFPTGCIVSNDPPVRWYVVTYGTNCSASHPGNRRACACQN
jgi:hypothetical protein